MIFPQTKKENIIDELSGIPVPDPYRWLENADDAEVKDWILNQNKYTESALKNDAFSVFSNELAKDFKVTGFSVLAPVNGKYFYEERQPNEDQAVLYMKNTLDVEPIKLIDPNGKREGNTMSLDYWQTSRSGRYVSYGMSEGGDEMATLHIRDTESNQDLPDTITHCRYSSVQWTPDDSAFFYTRNARPGTVPKNEEHLHVKVYLHKLGDDPDTDELVFGTDRPKDDMVGISLSVSGTYLGISATQKWTENDLYVYNRDTKEIKPLVTGIPAKFSMYLPEDKVLIVTDYKANNNRVLCNSYENILSPIDTWRELIPEREVILERMRLTKDKILVEYLVNACSEVAVFNYEGVQIEKIPLPKYSKISGIATERTGAEFFYGVESFIFPKIVYQYNPTTSAYSEYRRMDNPMNPENYEVVQEWCVSKDGVKVPMFIFHKKGLVMDGTNPTVLYGYGGFNHSATPGFMRSWVPWLEHGGIFVVANIRGGGEFGEKWHKEGIKEKKQNSFDDFISVAEHLVAQKYTSPKHLGIYGGSNGGLLVCAVGVQRPDLFSAVCSSVPLTDMVRFPQFGIAMRWVHEYGDPSIKEELTNILKWSPYHTAKEGIEYPSFLFATGEKDSRVDPLHSRKITALLQGINKKNDVYLFTEIDTGHGMGKPVTKLVESQAFKLSFFAQKLSLRV